MKNVKLYLILVVIFFGCSEKNPIEPNLSDSELIVKLIGKWSDGFSSVQFDANGQFQNEINEPFIHEYIYNELISGTFKIKDGILIYNIKEWKIKIVGDSSTAYGLSTSMPHFKIQIENNKLYFNPVNILTRIGPGNDDIWGEWSVTSWQCSYYPSRINPAKLYQLETIYKFNKDSMTVSYGNKFLESPIDSVVFFTSKIKYNPPVLSLDFMNDQRVEFHNGEMYMFPILERSPIAMEKIK